MSTETRTTGGVGCVYNEDDLQVFIVPHRGVEHLVVRDKHARQLLLLARHDLNVEIARRQTQAAVTEAMDLLKPEGQWFAAAAAENDPGDEGEDEGDKECEGCANTGISCALCGLPGFECECADFTPMECPECGGMSFEP